MELPHIIVPKNILDQLKCAKCNLYLSVPPIAYLPRAKSKLVCGRCSGSEARHLAIAYELVASLLLFPCRNFNEGCTEGSLTWENVKSHEDICTFYPVDCPTFSMEVSNCAWKGVASKFREHLLNEHAGMIDKSDEIQISLQEGNTSVLLKELYQNIYLIYFGIDDSGIASFYIKRILLDESEDTYFEYYVEFNNILKSSSWRTQYKIEPYAKVLEMNKVNIHVLKDMMKSTDITCSIILNKATKSKQICSDEANTIKELKKNCSDILHELECPICFVYMKPPIFVCKNGHSVCQSCVRKLPDNCSICRASMEGTRNISLEKIASTIDYPCKNAVEGCNFTGSIAHMNEHETNCLFCNIWCPLNFTDCTWNGALGNQTLHLLESHLGDNWISSGESVCHDWNNLKTKNYNILCYEDKFFIIRLVREQNWCIWKFHHIGIRSDELSPYGVTISVLGAFPRKVITNIRCYGITNKNTDIDINNNSMKISEKALLRFVQNNSLTVNYKILLF